MRSTSVPAQAAPVRRRTSPTERRLRAAQAERDEARAEYRACADAVVAARAAGDPDEHRLRSEMWALSERVRDAERRLEELCPPMPPRRRRRKTAA